MEEVVEEAVEAMGMQITVAILTVATTILIGIQNTSSLVSLL